MTQLTFADLRQANLERCGRWHPGFPSDETWTGADWANALGGEAGELAEAALEVVAYAGKVQNTVKKLRRYETGTNTATDKPLDVLLSELDAEMADVACYLDLLATKYGRDLAGAIVAKFNTVSERQGFPERLPAAAVWVHDMLGVSVSRASAALLASVEEFRSAPSATASSANLLVPFAGEGGSCRG